MYTVCFFTLFCFIIVYSIVIFVLYNNKQEIKHKLLIKWEQIDEILRTGDERLKHFSPFFDDDDENDLIARCLRADYRTRMQVTKLHGLKILSQLLLHEP